MKSGIIGELEETDDFEAGPVDEEFELFNMGMDGEPGWTNADGDRLRDYGVDEDEEDGTNMHNIGAQDEDVPLGELLRRRKNVSSRQQDGG